MLSGRLPCGSAGKACACNAEDLGSIPGLGRSSGEGNSYPLQYSGLENSMDCIVHGVAKSCTRLSDFHFHLQSIHLPRKRAGFNPWVGKIPWRGNVNPLQYPCLGNPIDRGTWWGQKRVGHNLGIKQQQQSQDAPIILRKNEV